MLKVEGNPEIMGQSILVSKMQYILLKGVTR